MLVSFVVDATVAPAAVCLAVKAAFALSGVGAASAVIYGVAEAQHFGSVLARARRLHQALPGLS